MITINTTPEQEKAMGYIAYSPQEWLQNAWDNRARKAMDQIVLKESDKQPGKLSVAQKNTFIRDADIKSAKERQDEIDRKLLEDS